MHSNVFHFTPAQKWMNDPNGMVYFQGEYHLFYQYNPDDIVWGPMHWGHAVSPDMVHWEYLPIALEPDEIGTIYSGSAVVDWKDSSGFFDGKAGLVAIFTHHQEHEEVQSIAYSLDKGRTWTKYLNNPVIKNPGKKDFRDPKVFWHEATNKWIAVLAYFDRVRLYSSPNLREWEYISEFAEEGKVFEGFWECPDLFELPVNGDEGNKKWVLKADIGRGAYAGGSGGMYYIGSFDGVTFTNENPSQSAKWLDYSQDFYAAQSWSDMPGDDKRVVWLGWMNNWLYANDIPAIDFRGMMTMPRRVELIELSGEIVLVQNPVKKLMLLRYNPVTESDFSVSTNKLYNFNEDVKAIELIAEIKVNSLSNFGLRFAYGNDEFTTIEYSGKDKLYVLDRSKSGKTSFSDDFKGRFEASLSPIDEKIKLQIFIDMNSVEIFGNEGMTNMTALVFPRENIKSVEIYSLGENTHFNNFEIYELRKN